MKNIGIVSLYCGESGKEGYYNSQEIGIAKAFVEFGFFCYIFNPSLDDLETSEREISKNIIEVKCPARHIGVHSRFDWKILLKYRLDYLQINADNQLYAGSLISFCEKNSIYCYTYNGVISSNSNNFIVRMVANVITSFNLAKYKRHKCFVKTEDAKKQFIDKGFTDVVVAPVGLDISIIPIICDEKDSIKKELDIPLNKKILLFVGRMEEYKKPLQMLEIFKQLNNNFYLIMIGTGSLNEKIEQEITNNDYGSRIRRINSLPNNEIHKFYYVSDYFINLNDKEIFGMSILEAMFQGCNVIAMKAPGPQSIIVDKKTGFIVEKENEILEIITHNKNMNNKMIQDGVASNMTWSRTVKTILENVH